MTQVTKDTSQQQPQVQKIPYRPITIVTLGEILDKYKLLPAYDTACKLLDVEQLLILRKDDDS